jgi:hypothetical protein
MIEKRLFVQEVEHAITHGEYMTRLDKVVHYTCCRRSRGPLLRGRFQIDSSRNSPHEACTLFRRCSPKIDNAKWMEGHYEVYRSIGVRGFNGIISAKDRDLHEPRAAIYHNRLGEHLFRLPSEIEMRLEAVGAFGQSLLLLIDNGYGLYAISYLPVLFVPLTVVLPSFVTLVSDRKLLGTKPN